MGEPGRFVMGACGEVLDLDSDQLVANDSGEIDRTGTPARGRDMPGKAVGDLFTNLETAGADVRADDCSADLPTRGLETIQKGFDDPVGDTPPPGMRHADRIIRDEHHPCTVGSEHAEREIGARREHPVRRSVAAWRVYVDDVRTVYLVDGRPLRCDAESSSQPMRPRSMPIHLRSALIT